MSYPQGTKRRSRCPVDSSFCEKGEPSHKRICLPDQRSSPTHDSETYHRPECTGCISLRTILLCCKQPDQTAEPMDWRPIPDPFEEIIAENQALKAQLEEALELNKRLQRSEVPPSSMDRAAALEINHLRQVNEDLQRRFPVDWDGLVSCFSQWHLSAPATTISLPQALARPSSVPAIVANSGPTILPVPMETDSAVSTIAPERTSLGQTTLPDAGPSSNAAQSETGESTAFEQASPGHTIQADSRPITIPAAVENDQTTPTEALEPAFSVPATLPSSIPSSTIAQVEPISPDLRPWQDKLSEEMQRAENNFARQAWDTLPYGKFLHNADKTIWLLYDRGVQGPPIRAVVLPPQLLSGNDRCHLFPFPSSLPRDDIYPKMCLLVQLPQLQAEAASSYLKSDNVRDANGKRTPGLLDPWLERTFGVKEMPKQQHALKTDRATKALWMATVRELAKSDRFREACKQWANGAKSDDRQRCWPPAFVESDGPPFFLNMPAEIARVVGGRT